MMNDQRKDCKGGQIRNVGTGWRSGERGVAMALEPADRRIASGMVATEKTTSGAEVPTENATRVLGLRGKLNIKQNSFITII